MKNKILLVHNHYKTSVPSGEKIVVEGEGQLLQSHGNEVRTFFRYSDDLIKKGAVGAIIGALSTPWNPFSAIKIRRVTESFKPDVVHTHNTFPSISPSIFRSIGSRSARVLTLHNYRLFCPAAIPLRDGRVCTECITSQSVMPSLRYGCYRNSRIATFPLAFNVALHRSLGTWSHQVDAFIALTDFQRELMVKAGLPAELVHVKPNFYPGEPDVLSWDGRRPSVVFAGRLTMEKGIESLVNAWMEWGELAPELRVLGDGELRDKMMKLASTKPEVPIRFLGQVSAEAAQREIAQSRLLILPSEWFEGFPMVIREAFAFGTPVAASNIGSIPEIVQQGKNGVMFTPGNKHSLLHVVKTAWNTEGELRRLATGARQSFETLYSEKANYDSLIEIYRQAIEVSQERKLH